MDRKEMDNKHKKKMIAPIIITTAFVLLLIVFGFLVMTSSGLNSSNILFVIPLIALGVGMIRTLQSRIKEIRSGEEDDLSNY